MKKEIIWPQKKTESEENLKLIRISSSRWRPFQKMCMFTLQGMTGLAVYHFLLNRTLIWGDGKVALCFQPHSGLSVGHETESWPMKGTCWSAGFLGELFESWHTPLASWVALSAFQKGRCDPAGSPLPLQAQGNSSQRIQTKLKGRGVVIPALDS